MSLQGDILKRKLAALAAIEQGGGDISGMRPDEMPDEMPEELPVAAPRTPQLGARTVQVSTAPPPDTELDDAKEMDAESMRRRLFETATRQLIGGLTRTAPQAALTQETKKAPELLAGRSKAKQEALRQLEVDNQGKRFDFERSEAERKALLAEKIREEDLAERAKDNDRAERGIKSRDEQTKAMNGLAFGRYSLDKAEKEAKAAEREDKANANTFPLAEGTFTIKKGLDDSAANKARSGGSAWNTALGNLDSLDGALSEYVQKPGLESKAKVEAQLQGAMTALNVAYGQGAMAESEARALSQALGADLKSPTAIAAAIQSWMGGDAGQAGKLLMTKIRTVREAAKNAAVKSLSPYGEFAGGGKPAAGVPPGRIHVSNGKEDFWVDASDVAAAEKDGYRRMSK